MLENLGVFLYKRFIKPNQRRVFQGEGPIPCAESGQKIFFRADCVIDSPV